MSSELGMVATDGFCVGRLSRTGFVDSTGFPADDGLFDGTDFLAVSGSGGFVSSIIGSSVAGVISGAPASSGGGGVFFALGLLIGDLGSDVFGSWSFSPSSEEVGSSA